MSTAAWPRTRCSARRPCSSTASSTAAATTRLPCGPRWLNELPGRFLVIPGRGELPELEQVQAERLDLGDDTVQGRLVQEPGEHGVGVVVLRDQGWERGQQGGAEVPVDPDHVAGGYRVHAAMVEGGQVTPHHHDPVTAGLSRPASEIAGTR